jgi:regulator of protease activity HflC (stomatin/prohibitin superfamily)
MDTYQKQDKKLKSGIALGIILFILFILIVSSMTTIETGHKGVLYKTFSGGVDTTQVPLNEGFHLVAPWNKVYKVNVKQQQLQESMKVLSSNGLDIQLDATVWFQPRHKDLAKLVKLRGLNYVEDVIRPAVRSAARNVLGRYTPEEIYSTKREAITKEIFDETNQILNNNFVHLKNILVRDVTLPATIKDAIERKLKQQQEALEYEYRLQKEKKEAERKRIEAKGIKDFQDIVSTGISDKLLRWKGIEATLKLSESTNTKVIVVGGKDGLPIIMNAEK